MFVWVISDATGFFETGNNQTVSHVGKSHFFALNGLKRDEFRARPTHNTHSQPIARHALEPSDTDAFRSNVATGNGRSVT